MTQSRIDCINALKTFSSLIKPKNVLEIGLAGDPKPSGSYEYFNVKDWKTMDKLPQLNPDIVFDLEKEYVGEKFELVICVNVLEHVYDIQTAIKNIKKMTSKYVIVGTPFNYPYHPELGFDDYWRLTPACIARMFECWLLIKDCSTDNFVCQLIQL